MSGKPNPDGVHQVIRAVRKMNEAKDRIDVLTDLINTSTDELNRKREEYSTARQVVFGQLVAMDVASSGNAGWHERMAAFLMMLVGDE